MLKPQKLKVMANTVILKERIECEKKSGSTITIFDSVNIVFSLERSPTKIAEFDNS